jgi:hypothetical protein
METKGEGYMRCSLLLQREIIAVFRFIVAGLTGVVFKGCYWLIDGSE